MPRRPTGPVLPACLNQPNLAAWWGGIKDGWHLSTSNIDRLAGSATGPGSLYVYDSLASGINLGCWLRSTLNPWKNHLSDKQGSNQ